MHLTVRRQPKKQLLQRAIAAEVAFKQRQVAAKV